MGPAVGIKTEFWEFPGQDFGKDLHQWTSNLTSGDDVPIVHSVSYGWQGNLSQIHVKNSDVETVDSNFAKLATMGFSIMISSGDSGSGYTEPELNCMDSKGSKGVGIEGEVLHSMKAEEKEECCEEAGMRHAAGWTFVKEKKEQQQQLQKKKKEGECTLYKTVTGCVA
jgi:hypothetical protein